MLLKSWKSRESVLFLLLEMIYKQKSNVLIMKKLRTRQHIIEDLGLNHIERQILLSGNILNYKNKIIIT